VDNSLIYLTGGLAWTAIRNNVDFTRIGPPANEHFAWTDNRLGWVTGAGIEHAFTSSISIKSEVLYVNLAESSHQFASAGCASVTGFCRFKMSEDMWVTRVGLNFRFGGNREVGPLK
jgi:opacity protein-like surface antigen